MTPDEAVAYIEGLDILGMRFGLARMRRLLAALGDPQRSAPAVHVVGTNGKSSTTRLAAAVLTAHGLRTGAYLSPHITGWHERIEVDGRAVGPGELAAAVTRVREAAEGLALDPDDGVTQFEVLTAAGFLVMADARVDAMVVEAGLGGRYDATNVLDGGRVTVLTNVALEHTELLGDTVAAIAGEKLAVAPDGSNALVIGRLVGDAAVAVEGIMAARGLRGGRLGHEFGVTVGDDGVTVWCPHGRYEGLPLGLRGRFQHDNLAVALAACEGFLGRTLDAGAVRGAVSDVRVPGRLEVFPGTPPVVLDGAHNPAGMQALVDSLPSVVAGRPVVAVVSLLADKNAPGMLRILAGACDQVVATRSRHRRATPPAHVADAARLAGLPAVIAEDAQAALQVARARAGEGGTVLVCGSLYLLMDLRPRVTTGAVG